LCNYHYQMLNKNAMGAKGDFQPQTALKEIPQGSWEPWAHRLDGAGTRARPYGRQTSAGNTS
jgi:hypothetical protein